MGEYRFRTDWTVEATPEEVSDILGDPGRLPNWWPSVYQEVKVVQEGDPDGVGRVVALWTKGFLPYRLHWTFRVTESRTPHGFRLEAQGDLAGTGEWRFEPDGRYTHVTYDWNVQANKWLLRRLSPWMQPLLEWNHRWAMERGEESLRLELRRRRGESGVPAPPGPMPEWPFWLLFLAFLGWLQGHLPPF